jgi:hypothetical protein
LTDIFILALPIKTLIGINRVTREKIALIGIFLIGTFATVTSIIRLHTIHDYTLADDPFRHSILVNLWSVIEINTGIICASAPALKALFTPRAIKEAASRYKRSNGTGGAASRYGVFSSSRGRERIQEGSHADTSDVNIQANRRESLDHTFDGIKVWTEFEMTDRRLGKGSETSSQDGIISAH